MVEESARCVIGNVPILEIPPSKKERSKNSHPIKLRNKPSPSSVPTNLHGFKIQTLIGLGEHANTHYEGRWKTAFKALKIGEGFEVSKKDFYLAGQTVAKYNRKAKSILGSARTFVFEKGVNAMGERDASVGRVGRIK